MKKALYIILLIAEFVVGFGLLTLVCMGAMGLTYLLVAIAVWAFLMVLLLVKMKKAAGAAAKRKVKVMFALAMLVPLVAALAGLGWFIWQMAASGVI